MRIHYANGHAYGNIQHCGPIISECAIIKFDNGLICKQRIDVHINHCMAFENDEGVAYGLPDRTDVPELGNLSTMATGQMGTFPLLSSDYPAAKASMWSLISLAFLLGYIATKVLRIMIEINTKEPHSNQAASTVE